MAKDGAHGAAEADVLGAAERLVTYDLAVLGLGGMGSAALAHAALRGRRVLGVERFAEGHEFGASSGRSRIIRKAYFESPAYVPLLHRAYELWHELEVRTGTALVDFIGLLMAGPGDGNVLAGARASAAEHGIDLVELDRPELARRYPSLHLRAGEIALFEREAGVVFPERGIAAHLAVASAAGAEVRFETAVTGYDARPEGIVLRFGDGTSATAARLAICAGPWLAEVARELGVPLRVQRNVQLWFEPQSGAYGAYGADRFPAFLVERADFPAPLYGFPDFGDGVKAAFHALGATTAPDALDREIHPSDVEPVARALEGWMPGAAGPLLSGKACMYALTPDEHFIIDHHPDDARIIIAGGFSGHGYKFCPVVGEIVSDLAFDGTTRYPIGFLSLDREVLASASQRLA